MDRPNTTMLQIGSWRVNPGSCEIARDGESARLEMRTMCLLLCLAERPGEVVSIDNLLDRVWPGVNVSADSVYQAIASLRRVLGDDPKQPTYIETVPRLGYRLVAAVHPWTESGGINHLSAVSPVSFEPTSLWQSRRIWAVGSALGLALVLAALVLGARISGLRIHRAAAATALPQKSIAVLPFLDLTEGMKEEEFADGMTEELIDKLSKIPDLRVPSPTASFYFKSKQAPIAEIAKTLGVVYVLDGSVRKSHGRLRVDARLVHAGDGYVVWSEAYDRPLDDILMVQEDIAGEVAKALRASIVTKPTNPISR